MQKVSLIFIQLLKSDLKEIQSSGLSVFQYFGYLQKMHTGGPFKKIDKLQKCRNYYIRTYVHICDPLSKNPPFSHIP